MTDMERFWVKVNRDAPGGCWLWTAYLYPNGYGSFRGPEGTVRAHRFAYERLVGPIPDGLVLDHLCRNPACVNPSHLEPVTQRENLLRGDTLPARGARATRCPRGHEYDGANTYTNPSGSRQCRACGAADARKRYRLRKLEATA